MGCPRFPRFNDVPQSTSTHISTNQHNKKPFESLPKRRPASDLHLLVRKISKFFQHINVTTKVTPLNQISRCALSLLLPFLRTCFMESKAAIIPIPPRRGLFSLLRAAIAGEHRDYTSGSLKLALFMLSVPTVLEMCMESLFAVVDAFYVSRVGKDALTTVALTEAIMMLVYSIAIGISMSATAFVARRTGEKNLKAAAESAVQAIYLAIIISIPFSLAGILFAPEILRIMGASPAVIATGTNYTRIMLGGNLVIILLFLNNAIFRGAGDASIAMRVLWLANILNMALGPLFIFGPGPFPELGVTGAAVATTTGRGIGVLYQFWMYSNQRSLIRIHRDNFALQPAIVYEMFKISLGGVSQFLISSASWIFVVRILATFGSAVTAGYTIAFRVIVFTILPAWGLANAAAALVGQNLGAKQPERAEKSVWLASYYNMIFLGVVSVIFFTFAHHIIGFFSEEAEVRRTGVLCLRIICLGYVFYAYGMVIGQAFNGAGDTRTPTILNVIGFWIVQIPLSFLLAKVFGMGPSGVFSAIAFSFSLLAILSIVVFRRGKWKAVRV
jgi:putative MATE family efflux protein